MVNPDNEIQSTLPTKAIHVQKILASLDRGFQVKQLVGSMRTAREAAEALGCTLGQIVKSLIFCAGENPILVLVSGSNRLDEKLFMNFFGSSDQACACKFCTTTHRLLYWRSCTGWSPQAFAYLYR